MSESISSQIFIPYETIGFCRESTVKGLLIGGTLLSLSIAAIATSGLLLPHTSFGIAMATLGESTLFYGTISAGVVSIALFSVFAAMQLKCFEISQDFVAEEETPVILSRKKWGTPDEEINKDTFFEDSNIGIFYKIKNKHGTTIGYLLGTVHQIPWSWPKLNSTIKRKIEKSKKLFVEKVQPMEEIREIEKSRKLLEKAQTVEVIEGGIKIKRSFSRPVLSFKAVDYYVYRHAQKFMSRKQIESLDDATGDKIGKKLAKNRYGRSLPAAYRAYVINAWLKGEPFDNTGIAMDIRQETIEEEFDSSDMDSWADSDTEGWPEVITQTRTKKDKEACANYWRFLIEGRNKRWIEKTLGRELRNASQDSKIFIAVGSAHLCDWECEEYKFQGLISMLQEEGWSFEKVG